MFHWNDLFIAQCGSKCSHVCLFVVVCYVQCCVRCPFFVVVLAFHMDVMHGCQPGPNADLTPGHLPTRCPSRAMCIRDIESEPLPLPCSWHGITPTWAACDPSQVGAFHPGISLYRDYPLSCDNLSTLDLLHLPCRSSLSCQRSLAKLGMPEHLLPTLYSASEVSHVSQIDYFWI